MNGVDEPAHLAEHFVGVALQNPLHALECGGGLFVACQFQLVEAETLCGFAQFVPQGALLGVEVGELVIALRQIRAGRLLGVEAFQAAARPSAKSRSTCVMPEAIVSRPGYSPVSARALEFLQVIEPAFELGLQLGEELVLVVRPHLSPNSSWPSLRAFCNSTGEVVCRWMRVTASTWPWR